MEKNIYNTFFGKKKNNTFFINEPRQLSHTDKCSLKELTGRGWCSPDEARLKALEDVSGLPEDLTESRGPFLFHREGGGETGLAGGICFAALRHLQEIKPAGILRGAGRK